MIGISGKTIPPPPRGDSLPGDGSYTQLAALPSTLDDDLHDLRRNLSYGEDAQDLKDALKRAIGLVEQLVSLSLLSKNELTQETELMPHSAHF